MRHSIAKVTILLFGFCLFFSHTAPSFAQEAWELDPGTAAVRAAGLGVSPQISQTIGDTTVNLNWAYADAFRMIINYTVTNSSGVAVFHNSDIQISDSANSFFMSRSGGGGGFINGQGTEYTYSFGIGLFEPNPAPLALHVELSLEALPQDYMGGGGGFGVGIWTPEMNPNPGIQANLGAARSGNPFVFDFSLPVLPATHLEPNQTVVAHEIPILLQSLDVTPSLTHAIICVADTRKPGGGVSYAGQTVRNNDSTEIGTNAAGQTCTDFIYPVSTRPVLTLNIDALASPMLSDAEQAAESARTDHFVQILSDQGIYISGFNIVDGFPSGYRIISAPEGIDVTAAIQNAWNTAFADVLMEPWVFQVSVGN